MTYHHSDTVSNTSLHCLWLSCYTRFLCPIQVCILITDTKTENQLKPDTIEALQILKCCQEDMLIIAEDEAAAHDPTWVPLGGW